MQTVHVRVNDAVTQKPTACRIRFTDAAGKYFAPLGRLADFPAHVSAFAEGNVFDGENAWSYIDGSCEIQLPPGAITIEIRKGLEYFPLNVTVHLAAGKLALRFPLERWTNGPAEGWFSGDSRVHLTSPHEALLAAAAEDVNVINLLTGESKVPGWSQPLPAAIANIVAFSGQEPCLEIPGHMVVVNTHNVHAGLGSLGLLHCHRIVYPLSIEKDDVAWTLADWCDQCHRKAGLVVWTDAYKQRSRLGGEGLADLILGKIDAFEMDREDFARFGKLIEDELYALWNAGLRVPLIGGSASSSNAHLVGRPRTYCKLLPGETLSYRNWIEAVRSGRTYVTGGALLSFKVNGHEPGDVVPLPADGQPVAVHVEARSHFPFGTLVGAIELLHNGVVLASARADQQSVPCTATLAQNIAVPNGGWLAVRCFGERSQLLAHSSPVYIQGSSQSSFREAAIQKLDSKLAKLMSRAHKHARLLHVVESAREVLRQHSTPRG